MTQQACIHEAQIVRSAHLRYLLHLPASHVADPGTKWPLILFLHGAGERGEDLDLVRKHGIPRIVEAQGDFPFIIVSPQCPEHSTWILHAEELMALLDEIIATQAVDAGRVYLTGLSMGGYGTWALALAHPQRFAAIAPICGRVEWYLGFPERASVLAHMPIWVFHGARDEVVPLEASQSAVEALKAAGGQVRFTIYPEAGHDSWTETYSNPELYAWFLSHSR